MPTDVRRDLDKLAKRANNIRPRELEKAATDAGWMLRRTTGSHAIYKKDGARRPLAIPIHAGAMKRGLALDLIKTIRDSL